jgi:hypothetical protein
MVGVIGSRGSTVVYGGESRPGQPAQARALTSGSRADRGHIEASPLQDRDILSRAVTSVALLGHRVPGLADAVHDASWKRHHFATPGFWRGAPDIRGSRRGRWLADIAVTDLSRLSEATSSMEHRPQGSQPGAAQSGNCHCALSGYGTVVEVHRPVPGICRDLPSRYRAAGMAGTSPAMTMRGHGAQPKKESLGPVYPGGPLYPGGPVLPGWASSTHHVPGPAG